MAVEHFLPSAIAHFEPADLIGALTTGIVMLDSDLCVVYANVAAQDLLAVSVNQARGKPFLSLVLEADSLGALMRRAVETGETLSERELSVQAGPLGREHRVIDVTMTPLDSEFDRKYLLLEIADATQRQRITRENELISRLDSSRQMVRQLAHEIKNPLGGLRGAAQLLERELHEHLREYTGVIISEADRLTALVDSMIGPARAPQKALINVHELCEHVYRLLRSEARGGVLVERDYDPSLPNAEVDANQIIQALLNIGRNALLADRRARSHRDSHARGREREHRHRASQARGQPFGRRQRPGCTARHRRHHFLPAGYRSRQRHGPRPGGFTGPRDATRRPHRI